MLPVNFPTKEVSEILSKHGVKEDDVLAAIHFDLDTEGNFGNTWLVLDKKRKRICRIDMSKELYDEFELALLANPYIDNFNTSNALLAYSLKEPLEFTEDMSERDFEKRSEKAAKDGVTVTIGYCTNACKRRLFAFVRIWERLLVGEEVTEDDPVFDQFYAKCPQCGKVYEDQNRRICSNCVNRKGLLIRLLSYFKPFKLTLVWVIILLALISVFQLISPVISGQLIYDQIVTEPNKNVTESFPETDLSGSTSIFGRFKSLIYIMADNKYYYYRESLDGKYVFDGKNYIAAEDGNTKDTRYEMVLTRRQSENENAVKVTGRIHSLTNVYYAVILMVVIALLSMLVSILSNRSLDKMSARVVKNMKNDIFGAMSKLSLSYFNQNPTGRLITRVNYDADKIRDFYVGCVPYLLVNIANFVGITIMLFSINVKLTLIVFVPVPFIVCLFKFMLPKLWRSYSRQWRRSSSLNAMLGDVLGGERVVKAFAKEVDETARFGKYADRICEACLKTNLISLFIFPVFSLLVGITSQAIWGFGGINVMGGRMTYGQLTTFVGYLWMVVGPLEFLTNFSIIITDTINSAQRMFEIIDTVPEIADSKDAVGKDVIDGNITFDRVCFHYTPNRPILNNISFEIHAGDHVGLVGHTGSGKSTIANLITRMYDVISGTVYIDGINIKELETRSLRKNIAIVSQEVFIFGGTIADNIRYAKPEATMDEVITAAKAANAHDFIMRMPEGYETMVGIGNRSLSGGERQRISIARALLLAPSVLILDEATAAMDNETERQISSAIDKLIEGRTTISIAHRLSTLKNCNYIMAIEHGELAEMGPAEELLEKKGIYYNLYKLQNDQMNQVAKGE